MAQDKTTEEQHCDIIIYVYVEQSARLDKWTSKVSTLTDSLLIMSVKQLEATAALCPIKMYNDDLPPTLA